MRVRQHLVVCAICIATCGFARAGEVVDRMVANVNGHILLQSDWEQEVTLEALLNGRSADSFTAAERKAALDRLIDQELLREQVPPAEGVPATQVAARLTEIRKLFPEATSEQGWHAVLQRYGLSEQTMEKRVAEDLELMHSVEARLRPSIQIDQKAIEAYYQDQLLPQLKKAGGKEIALAEVFSHIRDVLAEQKLSQLLSSWLTSLRSEGRIETHASDPGVQSP